MNLTILKKINQDFSKNDNKKVSIIIPCKNEENNISKLVNDSNYLEFPYELVFIDDKRIGGFQDLKVFLDE